MEEETSDYKCNKCGFEGDLLDLKREQDLEDKNRTYWRCPVCGEILDETYVMH
jgi:predicted RNA-binding Zn-ribbon protein involved in translation (DUF1610 family)